MHDVFRLIGRWFASAFVRRIAYAAAAALLVWLGATGEARAQYTGCSWINGNTMNCATEPQALAAANGRSVGGYTSFCPVDQPPIKTAVGKNSASYSFTVKCGSDTGTAIATESFQFTTACPMGQPPNPDTLVCDAACSTRSTETGWRYAPNESITVACYEGCFYEGGIDITTGLATYFPSGATCVPNNNNGPIVDPDSDGDGVPDSTDDFPNDPGETTDSDGDGVGDNNDPDPNDPDNGGDDGSGDETDNQASGGALCGAPPVCSGDGILCATLFQTWKGRCATERIEGQLEGIKDGIDNIGGVGTSPEGLDTLDELAEEGNSLLGQIKAAVEDISDMLRGIDETGVPDMTGPNVPEEEMVIEMQEWDSGMSGAAACPVMEPVTLEWQGQTVTTTFGIEVLCEFADRLYAVIVALGALLAGMTIVRGLRS